MTWHTQGTMSRPKEMVSVPVIRVDMEMPQYMPAYQAYHGDNLGIGLSFFAKPATNTQHAIDAQWADFKAFLTASSKQLNSVRKWNLDLNSVDQITKHLMEMDATMHRLVEQLQKEKGMVPAAQVMPQQIPTAQLVPQQIPQQWPQYGSVPTPAPMQRRVMSLQIPTAQPVPQQPHYTPDPFPAPAPMQRRVKPPSQPSSMEPPPGMNIPPNRPTTSLKRARSMPGR
jgi:hypothetical protein